MLACFCRECVAVCQGEVANVPWLRLCFVWRRTHRSSVWVVQWVDSVRSRGVAKLLDVGAVLEGTTSRAGSLVLFDSVCVRAFVCVCVCVCVLCAGGKSGVTCLASILFVWQGDAVSKQFQVKGPAIGEITQRQLEWRMCHEWRIVQLSVVGLGQTAEYLASETQRFQQECIEWCTRDLPRK